MNHAHTSFSLRSRLAAMALAASGALFAPLASAGVISNPASIVDHGSYITDTVNQRDWYKFSNAVNTVGWSINSWTAANLLPGWSVANVAQVKGLESQFGWVADTVVGDWSPNYALTEAMADYLGHTFVLTTIGSPSQTTSWIQAMTSDQYYLFDDATQDLGPELRQVTTSQFFETEDNNGQMFYYGDYVNSDFYLQGLGETDDLTGIWLSRASSEGGGAGVDCGRLAPCQPAEVPEPGSAGLVLISLGGLLAFRRGRGVWAARQA